MGKGFYLLATVCRLALGPIQPFVCWGSLPRIKQPGHEADRSSPSSVKDNAGSCNSTPQYAFMAWYLVKHRDCFMFTIHNLR